MVGGSDLTSNIEGRDCVLADQAIFTSVPSSTGEGYRIVSATASVSAEERRELTRRSPSHDSLIDEGEGVSGLLSLPLESGRFAVGLVRFAGEEHTGRGGQRVHTHFVVLTRAQFERYAGNPVKVAGKLQDSIGTDPWLGETACYNKLQLEAKPPGCVFPRSEPRSEAALRSPDVVLAVADALLGRASVLLRARNHAAEILEWALLLLPLGLRVQAGVSLGLRFAAGRGLACCVVPERDVAAMRATRGHGIVGLDTQAGMPSLTSDFGPWLDLARERWNAGRTTELHRLTGRMTADVGASQFELVVGILEDLERVAVGEVEDLQEMIDRYAAQRFGPELERDLADQLIESAKSRLAALPSSDDLAVASQESGSGSEKPGPGPTLGR